MLKYWNNSQMFWKPILRTFLALASCDAEADKSVKVVTMLFLGFVTKAPQSQPVGNEARLLRQTIGMLICHFCAEIGSFNWLKPPLQVFLVQFGSGKRASERRQSGRRRLREAGGERGAGKSRLSRRVGFDQGGANHPLTEQRAFIPHQ